MQIDETTISTHMKIQKIVKIIFYTKLLVPNNDIFLISKVKQKYYNITTYNLYYSLLHRYFSVLQKISRVDINI